MAGYLVTCPDLANEDRVFTCGQHDRSSPCCLLGGTAGAIATCPLEVVKTRLQSSVSNFGSYSAVTSHQAPVSSLPRFEFCNCATYERFSPVISSEVISRQQTLGIWRCLR
ncbi:hypothetical protein CEXT_632681 [Caerostris extrusa]|uniref:Uncharacterized protein n=1 Tax=Caerostris extrusa TaxID=172846 RepID=A0AAV4VUL6_CAEEX|nr:hypothetical protein CEXT_632681 [Caerostris extrusa]